MAQNNQKPGKGPKLVEAATAATNTAQTLTSETLTTVGATMIKSVEDMSNACKPAVDAFVQAGQIWAKGAEEIGRTWLSLTQANVEKAMANGKAVMGVKNVKDLVDLQSEFLREQFDSLLAEGTRLSELTIRVANQAAEPIQQQFNSTVSQWSRAA